MKKITKNSKRCLALMVYVAILVGCQSTPSPKSSNEQPLKVIKSSDGVQNIRWKIVSVNGKKAQFFFQQPSLMLNPQSQRMQGNTGCNAMFGEYRLNSQTQQLSMTVKANHQSCDGALAQEADLLQSLMAVQRYQLSGNSLNLLDAQGRTLIVLQP